MFEAFYESPERRHGEIIRAFCGSASTVEVMSIMGILGMEKCNMHLSKLKVGEVGTLPLIRVETE